MRGPRSDIAGRKATRTIAVLLPKDTLALVAAIFVLLFPVLPACSCGRVHLGGDAGEDHLPADSTDGSDESGDDGDSIELECGPCDDSDPCTADLCDTATGNCIHSPVDADGDGHPAAVLPDGTTCGGDDCDDSRDDTYPGASEICNDGLDEDCDGFADTLKVVSDPLFIEVTGGIREPPGIAWTGSEFGILWIACCGPLDPTANIVRIARDGSSVIDQAQITDPSEGVTGASFVWTGSKYGLVVSIYDTAYDERIRFIEFSSSGELLSGDIAISENEEASYIVRGPSIAWTGDGYGIAWVDNRDGIGNEDSYGQAPDDIYFTRIDTDGNKVVDDVRVTDAYGWAYFPSIAWSGSSFLIAWADDRVPMSIYTGPPSDFYFVVLNADGSEANPEFQLNDDVFTNCSIGSNHSSAAWAGSRFALAWANRVQLISDSFMISTYYSGDRFESCAGNLNALAVAGDKVAVAINYMDLLATVSSLNIVTLGLTDPFFLSITKFYEESPSNHLFGGESALTWTGSEYGVVWTGRPDGYGLLFSRINNCE